MIYTSHQRSKSCLHSLSTSTLKRVITLGARSALDTVYVLHTLINVKGMERWAWLVAYGICNDLMAHIIYNPMHFSHILKLFCRAWFDCNFIGESTSNSKIYQYSSPLPYSASSFPASPQFLETLFLIRFETQKTSRSELVVDYTLPNTPSQEICLHETMMRNIFSHISKCFLLNFRLFKWDLGL